MCSLPTATPFHAVLSHPAHAATLPPKPAPLTASQSETYQTILDHLSAPDFKLPTTLAGLNSGGDGSEQPLSDHERCYCSREFILRTCRATRWDTTASLRRADETLVWRRQYGVDDMNHETMSKESETGKQFVLGYDIHSRPCLYMHPNRQNTKPSEDQIKFVVWCLERTIDLMPPGIESLTLLIDFGSSKVGSSATGQPTTFSQAKSVLHILQTYYCERLGRAICINVPWLFWGFYKLIKPLMDPRTVDKIKFNPDVTELVPAEQLEKGCFGGEFEFEYDHSTYFPALIALAQERREAIMDRYKKLGEKIGLSEFDLRGGGDLEEEVPSRPRLRHHAETDAGDSVFSEHPPSSPEAASPEAAGVHEHEADVEPALTSNPEPVFTSDPEPVLPSDKSVLMSDPEAGPISDPQAVSAPASVADPQTVPTFGPQAMRMSEPKIVLVSEPEVMVGRSEPEATPKKGGLVRRFGSIRHTIASHIHHTKNDEEHGRKEKKERGKKEKKTVVTGGIVVVADAEGHPLPDQTGASRNVESALRHSLVK